MIKTPKKIPIEKWQMKDWLLVVEQLIGRHTTPPAKKGKYKGHGFTNVPAWLWDLISLVQIYIRKRNKGKAYDENMAVANRLGSILVVWYCTVHRAKSYDPNRPLSRRKANVAVTKFRGGLMQAVCDDRLLGLVFGKGQQWNFPFGKGAKGGKFV